MKPSGFFGMGSAVVGIILLIFTFTRSEEHTSELQSRLHLVCRLLLEKKRSSPLSRTPHRPSAWPPPTHEAPCRTPCRFVPQVPTPLPRAETVASPPAAISTLTILPSR